MTHILKHITIIGTLAFSVALSAQTRTQTVQKKVQVSSHKNGAPKSKTVDPKLIVWIKQTTQNESPSSWNLLMQYNQLPDKIEAKSAGGSKSTYPKPVETFHFLEGHTKTELLQSMATNVHELSHAYYRHNAIAYSRKNNRPIDWNNAEGYIYLSPSQWYFVSFPQKRMFPSKDLAKVIPANLRTLRYSTYISGNTSTQSQGVMGLLNEFHAYYLGAKYAYDVEEAYCAAGKTAADGFMTWVQHTQSMMDAYYELDFFIREYLLYMSSNHPKSYAALKANRPFWQAFFAIEKAYSELNRLYQQRIKSEVQRINNPSKGKLAIEGNMLWMSVVGGKRQGASLALKAKQKLSTRLNSNRYNKVVAQ